MKNLVHRAMNEMRFNDVQKHDIGDDEIRLCLNHPELSLFIFKIEYLIFWSLFYFKTYTLI